MGLLINGKLVYQKKNQICPAATIGQIAGVTGHFWGIGKFRKLYLFFSSINKINDIEHIFKGITISKKCFACTSFNYMQLFL